MAITTAWLVGSYAPGSMFVTLNGTPMDVPVSLRGVYLRHETAALSLIDLVQTAMLTVPIAGAQVRVLENRLVRISATNTFTVTWTSTVLRTLLGFTSDLAGQNSYTGTLVSPILWSPGKPESPTEAPFGCLGRPVYDTRFSTAPDGTQVASSSFTQTVATYAWPYVAKSRYQTPQGLGGEYLTFFDWVLVKANKLFLYRQVQEDLDGSDPVDWPEDENMLGPYGFRPTRSPISPDFQRSRGLESVDWRMNVNLDLLVVPEWSGY